MKHCPQFDGYWWVRFLGLAVILIGLGPVGCVPEKQEVRTEPKAWRWEFPTQGVTIAADFPRGRVSECEALADGVFGLVIRPENLPVNDSPWYAFQVSSRIPRSIKLKLRVQGGNLRYRPKISVDGTQWVRLPDEAYEQAANKTECLIRLEVDQKPLWVAAQELVSTEEMTSWAGALQRLPFVARSEFGRAVSGQRLCRIDIGDSAVKRHVVVIGRQHPPETTGSMALMSFVEEIVGDSERARAFREHFHVVVMPLLNPDGVDAGNWRHNLGRVDLNRDWKAFAQPETRSVRDQVEALAKDGRLFLFLDFHSTFKDVFYTQADEVPSSPPGFTSEWLGALERRLPDYRARRQASPVPTPTTSTYWAHRTFGIPAITYEIGDNTNRAQLKIIAATAAEEMMRLLLEMKDSR
jgi:hypothetical protein